MTLIKCPGCGHTVSSVASKCPQCGTLLTQFRFVQGAGGGLTECRRCSRKVLSGAGTCPYCGVSHPGRRRPYAVIGILIAFAIPALVVAALSDRGFDLAPTPPMAPAVLQQPAPLAAAASAPAPSAPVSADTAAAGEPGSADFGSATDTIATETRWTVDWANVREGRALGTRVVRVLRPGSSVRVTDRQAGWWALYADGRLVGYLAGSLLTNQPPTDTRPEGRSDRG